MRIAYISADRGVPVIGRSGSSTHVREIVGAFLARGLDVTMLTACPPGASIRTAFSTIDLSGDPILQDLRMRTAQELRLSGHDAVRASETYGLLLNQTLLQELMRLRGTIDVIYERQSLWSFAGLQFARREGLPFFLEVNAPLAAQQQEYRTLDMVEMARAVESLLFAKADRVLVTCSALRDYARARGAAHVRIIPCGVSADWLVDRSRLAAPKRPEFVVGFVGSLKPWHGVELLLRAFARLCDRSPAYRLLIVGDGPLRSDVEAYCRHRHLEDRVTMAGAVDPPQVPGYLAQMDVGLAPYPPLQSFYFSPLKVWEYAAAGVPIVASASGDLPRLFPHRTAALLHPPGSVKKIVEHVESLRQDRELGGRLARRARQVAKRHTWDRLALRIELLATHLLARGCGRIRA